MSFMHAGGVLKQTSVTPKDDFGAAQESIET